MLNSKLFALSLAAVLTFGLAACAPDKKTRTDDWSVASPEIMIPAGSQLGYTDGRSAVPVDSVSKPSLRDLKDRILPLNAQIVFPSLEALDPQESPSTISAAVSCSYGQKTASANLSFKNASRLSMLALLPRPLLAGSSDSSDIYRCGFNFNVTDQYGSGTSFVINSIVIANAAHSTLLRLQAGSDKADLADGSPSIADADLANYTVDASGVALEASLICDRFTLSKDYADGKEFHLSDFLAAAKVHDGSTNLSYAWRQTCRLLVVPQAHPENAQLSKFFDFGSDAPKVVATPGRVSCEAGMSAKFAEFTLSNQGDQTAVVGLRAPQGFRIFGLYSSYSGGLGFNENLLITTQAQSLTAGGFLWIEIKPGQDELVTMNLDMPIVNLCSLKGQFGSASPLQIALTGRAGDLSDLTPQGTVSIDANLDVTGLLSMPTN